MRDLLPLIFVFGCSEYQIFGKDGAEAAGVGDTAAPDVDTAQPEADPEPDPDPDPDPDTGMPAGSGSVSGRICDPSGSGWVAHARVWVEVDTDGDGVTETVIETTTDADGRFVLEGLPPGTWEVHVEKGSFSTSFTVEVTDGSFELPDDECLDPGVDIAVLRGSYDVTEEILETLGLSYDLIEQGGTTQLDFLRDEARLASYDIVFLNCGMDEDWLYTGTERVTSNLVKFVEDGHSLYASDWAFLAVEAAFPDAIDFYGDDAFLFDAYGGDDGTLEADVVDPTMQALLGSAVADIHYDLAGWVMAVGTESATEVLVRGSPVSLWEPHPLEDVPLAVRFEAGAGRVVFTTFHNEPQITSDMELMLREIILSL
jgi:hypothetical protein